MRDLFLVMFYINLAYFLLKKRKVDFFLLAFISASVYFLPAFFGYYTLPTTYAPEIEMVSEAYIIYSIFYSALLFFTLAYDFLFANIHIQTTTNEFNIPHLEIMFLSISLFGAIGFFYSFGKDVFSDMSKTQLLEKENGTYWAMLWTTSADFVLLLAFINKRWRIFQIGSALLLLNMFVGHRSAAAFAAISIVICFMFEQGNYRLILYFLRIKNLLKNLAVILLIYFFFLYKQFAGHIRNFRFDFIVSSATNLKVYEAAITQSEPFIIQTNLNETIRQHVHTDHIALRSIIKSFGFSFNKLDFQDDKLKYLSQEMIYPKLNYGTGNNIWAFIFSSEGWLGLIIFVLIFFSMILIGNLLLNNSNKILKAFIVVFFVCICFYSHRNGLFFQIEIQKRVTIIFLMGLVSALIFNALIKASSKSKTLTNSTEK